jgi:hypothetical protein
MPAVSGNKFANLHARTIFTVPTPRRISFRTGWNIAVELITVAGLFGMPIASTAGQRI